jgi:hypothetical protein
LVTVRIVPKGRLGWAAVYREELKISPEAVGRPSNSVPYQDAMPSCRKAAPGAWAVWAAQNPALTRAVHNTAKSFFILHYIGKRICRDKKTKKTENH